MKKENTAEEYETRGRAAESIRLLNRRRPCGAEKNARQLDVAGFVCKAPLRGCAQPPRGFAIEGRSFQLPAVPGPNALRPRPSPVGGSRTERPATKSCGLRLQSPLAGAATNRPRRFRR